MQLIKYFILIIVYCLLRNNALAQNNILTIPDDTIYEYSSDIDYDEIIVKGTLRHTNGTITCNTLTIDGGKWESFTQKTITVNSNFSATNATIAGSATATFNIGGNVIFNEECKIDACALTVEGNMEILGNLELTAQLGVKRIMGNMVISGTLNNSANDYIEIFGDVECYGTIITGNFRLFGSNNALRGNIFVETLYIEGKYTNYGIVTIDGECRFTGNGTFIQAEGALLVSNAPGMPKLIASAQNNTVRLIRNGVITINCVEFYNLECATSTNQIANPPIFSLVQNTAIANSLKFEQQCFLNLQDFSLTFPQWSNNTITQGNPKVSGIILGNGIIKIENIEQNQTVHIPLYHGKEFSDFAHIAFTNNDEEITNFEVKRMRNFITNNSLCNGRKIYDSPYISAMYDITSRSKNSTLDLYWHQQKELTDFDRSNCHFIFFNTLQWETFGEKTQAQQATHENIYFLTTNYASSDSDFFTFGIKSENFLPIGLTHFTVTNRITHNELTWETANEQACDYFLILKSVNGLDFSPYAHIAGNGTTSVTHKYSFCDKELSATIIYYQLEQYDYNGSVWKSNIISVQNLKNQTIAQLIRKNQFQCEVQTEKNENCFISNCNGTIVATFDSNTEFDFSHFTSGIYFVNAEHSKISDNCIVVH